MAQIFNFVDNMGGPPQSPEDVERFLQLRGVLKGSGQKLSAKELESFKLANESSYLNTAHFSEEELQA